MKRTGFDEHRDRQIADDFTANRAACHYCGMSTERATLSEYGARCGPCFTQFVTGGKPNPPMPSIERRRAIVLRLKAALGGGSSNPYGWAHRLQAMRDAGQALSKAQRDCLAMFESRRGDRRSLSAGVVEAAKAGAPVPMGAMTMALQASGDIDPPDFGDIPWPEHPDDAHARALGAEA